MHNNDGIATPTGSTAAQIAKLKGNYSKDLNIDNRIAKFKMNTSIEYLCAILLILVKSVFQQNLTIE